jgi:hypothetical protein
VSSAVTIRSKNWHGAKPVKEATEADGIKKKKKNL